ncbi:MAG: DUF4239 domain-containing protein [Acidobacteria bacterium]|nr:DUF4239 domain-containing protein [Acidobacteriota bacterium]
MNPAQWGALAATLLFFGLLACLEIGYRMGRRLSADREFAHEGTGAIEGAVFALLGLLLAFSFAGGTSRLEARRQLIIQEANAIGTAYLRVDLLPDGEQVEMRRLFREYLDSRLRVYDKLPELHDADVEIANAAKIQGRIWSRATTASRTDTTQNAARLLLPAINEMIDVTTSRTVALHTHQPPLILALLISVALLSGLLAGYAMSKRQTRSWPHIFIYALAVSITVYAVVDLDYPRSGLIRLDSADSALMQLRDSIR